MKESEQESDQAKIARLERALKERHRFDEIEGDASRLLDNAVLTLSAAFLGLSLTFLKDIRPKPIWWTYIALVLGWISFGISITFMLISFNLSKTHSRHLREEFDHNQANEKPYVIPLSKVPSDSVRLFFKVSRDDPWGDLIDRYSGWSLGLCLLGIYATIFFCLVNLLF